MASAVRGPVGGPSSGSTLPSRNCCANSAKEGLASPSLGILYPLRTAHFHPLDPKPNLVTSPDPAWQERSRSGAVPGHRNHATSGYLLQGNLNPRIAERAHLAHLGFAVWRRRQQLHQPARSRPTEPCLFGRLPRQTTVLSVGVGSTPRILVRRSGRLVARLAGRTAPGLQADQLDAVRVDHDLAGPPALPVRRAV